MHILDQMRYLVVSAHRDGPLIHEVCLADMSLVKVAKDIRDRQYGDVLYVIEFNPIEHICRDATHEFKDLLE